MRRPSHFMLLFLVCVGTPLCIWGDDLAPEDPTGESKKWLPRLLDRGRQIDAPADPAPEASAPAQAERREDQHSATVGPWILCGNVVGESSQSGSLLQGAIGLELVPVGDGHPQGDTLLTTIAGPEGGFRWAGLHPGAYRVRAIPSPNDAASHLDVAVSLELPEPNGAEDEDRTFRQDLMLPRPRRLQGAITTPGKLPKAGVTVHVSESGLHRGTAISKVDGTFEIDRVGLGPFEVEVRTNAGAALPVHGVQASKAKSDGVRLAVVVP